MPLSASGKTHVIQSQQFGCQINARTSSNPDFFLNSPTDVVLREEFDNWAIPFDPATGNAFGLNPVGVFVWERLDDHPTRKDILNEPRKGPGQVSGYQLKQYSKGPAGAFRPLPCTSKTF